VNPNAIILSPHFDDAVLSCWHVLATAGEVLVVNVFAGKPPVGTLGWWDRLAGATDSAAMVQTRIEEDSRALALAGCTAVNLPFLDGQYRQADQPPGEIVEALREVLTADTRVYAPASVGHHHHDHAAVLMAALALHAEGAEVTLYADLPHATMLLGWPRWVPNGNSSSEADPAGEQWASQLKAAGVPDERLVARTQQLSAAEHAGKLEALFTYDSQIASLQQLAGSSLTDRQTLGFEVTWQLGLVT
jgi:hypothetical protein